METPSYLSSPSFWKLLMEDDFKREIRIPHSFTDQLERRKSPCNYSLITGEKQGSSDRSWRAKLVKRDHYYYLCRKSWPEFVRDHNLKYGDLLLFHLVDKTTFRVTPYCANGSMKKLDDDDDEKDSDTCESESDEADEDDYVRAPTEHRRDRKHRMNKRGGSTPMLKKARKSIDHKVYKTDEERIGASSRISGKAYGGRNKEVDESSREQIEKIKTAEEASNWDHFYDLGVAKPYFIRTIKVGHKYNVVVPRPFAMALELNKVGEVELQWGDGNHQTPWMAKIIVAGNASRGRIDIGGGWRDFQRRFDIRVGDTCRFTVNHRGDDPIVISVHVFRSGDHKSRN